MADAAISSWHAAGGRISWFREKSGRRGCALAILAFIDFGYGGGLAAGYVPLFASHRNSMLLPLVAWGWVWIAVGAVCLTGVLARRDRIQFGVAMLLKTAWSCIITMNWLMFRIPGGWTSVAAWAGIALLVLLISGWPEATPRR